jgi:hypothetical protein
MHITAMMSSYGAWKKLTNQQPDIYYDIVQALSSIDPIPLVAEQNNGVSTSPYHTRRTAGLREVKMELVNVLGTKGWKETVIKLPATRLFSGLDKKRIIRELDLVKGGVGLDIFTGQAQYLTGKIFSDLPFFVRSEIVDLITFLVPIRSFEIKMGSAKNNGSFEAITNRLHLLEPTSLRYPFLIIGYSDEEKEVEVIELTNELDQFLIAKVGLSLSEMVVRNEMANYDFKIVLPANDKIAKEICAMANSKGGGILLIGIDKTGEIIGLRKGNDLDDIQLRVSNIIHTSLSPRPVIQFRVFDIPGESNKCLVVIEIEEIEYKPCMTGDRVYIRGGSSAVPAGPDEIRRLIIEVP